MMQTADHKLHVQAWGISAILHGLIAGLAVMLLGQIKPPPVKDLFEWDVSLVQSVVQEAKIEPAPPALSAPVLKPQPKKSAAIEPVPQVVTRQVQTIEQPAAVQRVVQQVVETVKPIEEAVKPIERPVVAVQERSAVMSEQQEIKQAPVQERPAEQVVQAEAAQEPVSAVPVESAMTAPSVTASVRSVEPVAAVETSAVVQREPIHHADPVATYQPSVETPPAPVAATSLPAAQPNSAVASVPGPSEPDVTAAPVQSAEPAPVVASAAPVRPATKADNAWLAESLGRRIREVTRYPSSARLNGTEGKVVLRVVLRADGHLSDVTVHRSSGHEVLDRAAIETVRLACPIHMKRALSAPEVAVYVPIVYSLAG